LLTLGAILRIARWAHWRALWLDEIYLASSIVSRGYHDLLCRPLDAWQIAPPGFLLCARLCVQIFGAGERALRLPSLIFGLASLPLFLRIARRVLPPRGGIFAIALMACLGPLIYYSNELKQYSCDVAAALAIVLSMLRLIERPCRGRTSAAAIVGVVSIFFSQPAIFVLAGTGIIALWQFRFGRAAREIPKQISQRRLFIVGAIWLMAFAFQYAIFLRPELSSGSHSSLVQSWAQRDAFMPISPVSAPIWLFERFRLICQEPGAMWLSYPDAGIIAILLGLFAAIVARKPGLLLILSPIPIAILASAMKQYPLADRLALFIVPSLILLMGAGIDFLWSGKSGTIAAIVIACMIFLPTGGRAMGYLFYPPGREESLGAYQWVAAHWQPGDTLYLSGYADASYEYYKSRALWPGDPAQSGMVKSEPRFTDGLRPVLDDIHNLAGKNRVWLVFIVHNGDEESQITLASLDQIGISDPQMIHREDGAAVYLYNCPTPSNSPAPN
jgi:uncharacterized membrane protein